MDDLADGIAEASSRPRRRNSPEATRRDILAVAMREFASNGLSGARIDEIADKTRSSKRMIYYYFGDKEGLYLRCLEEAYRVVRRGEEQLRLEDLPPREALRRLVEFTVDHHASNRDFVRLVMIENIHNASYLERSETIRGLNATAIDNLRQVYERGVAASQFRAGLRPIDLHWHISALSFFNISNQATFSHIFEQVREGPAAHAERREQVVEMILRFVSVSPGDRTA